MQGGGGVDVKGGSTDCEKSGENCYAVFKHLKHVVDVSQGPFFFLNSKKKCRRDLDTLTEKINRAKEERLLSVLRRMFVAQP